MEKHYLGHRKRLKERFLSSPQTLPDYELMELILGYVIRGRDVKKESKEIIKLIEGNFNNLFTKDIQSIDGIGLETSIFFKIIMEFNRRLSLHRHNALEKPLKNPTDVYNFIKYNIGFAFKESFFALLLNSSGIVTNYKVLSTGTVNSSSVYIREIVEYAITNKAVGVIIAHNHPSGTLNPSKEDIDITKKIKDALKLVEIELYDHIIVTAHGYISFLEKNLF
ncbi:MAG: DNA repair protein RadC [Calditerrivibrio sp.]|nr:DNA repair protein RadC [Calditerrivibrio sp.]